MLSARPVSTYCTKSLLGANRIGIQIEEKKIEYRAYVHVLRNYD